MRRHQDWPQQRCLLRAEVVILCDSRHPARHNSHVDELLAQLCAQGLKEVQEARESALLILMEEVRGTPKTLIASHRPEMKNSIWKNVVQLFNQRTVAVNTAFRCEPVVGSVDPERRISFADLNDLVAARLELLDDSISEPRLIDEDPPRLSSVIRWGSGG